MSHTIIRTLIAALALLALFACQRDDAPAGRVPGEHNGEGNNGASENNGSPENNGEGNNGEENNGAPENNGAQQQQPLRAEAAPWVGLRAPQVAWASLFAASNGGETHWRCRPSALEGGGDRAGWDCKDPSRENGGETHWSCRPEVANGGETHWFCTQASRENGGETHWSCRPEVANGGETHWRCGELRWDDFSVGQGVACGLGDGRVRCWGDDLLRLAVPEDVELVAVAAGQGAACGLDPGGVPRCWSSQEGSPLLSSPSVPLMTISLGGRHACGLRSDGGAVCWGDDGLGQASPPLTPLRAVSAGGQFSCGLSLGGGVLCWGGGAAVGAGVPEGDGFVAVTAGLAHACALRGDGGAVCWGDDAQGQLAVPPGQWRALSAGAAHTCGLDDQGAARCWGAAEASAGLPAVALTRISAGRGQSCGLTAEDALVCWGAPFDEEAPARCGLGEEGQPNACGGCGALSEAPGAPCEGACPGAAVQCDGLEATACVEQTPMNACGGCAPLPLSPAQRCGACGDGVVDCAGEDALACSCDERRWTQIVAGDGVTCGVGGLNGAVSCWGDDNNTVTGFPGASWVQLALGDRHLCGVDVRGSVTCFGDNDRGQLFPTVLVGANVIALVAAGDAACALTVELDPGNNHNLYCWGAVPVGYVEGLVPEGRFEGVALGIGHLCVWGSEGVACIGDDAQGQATPPPALADTQEVVAGLYYTCALSRGGEVRCWGRAPLVANTPTERFSRLFGGFGAVCGLNDAGISCWGEELPARRLFEGGDWQRAVVGRYHICGLDGDRALSCVGELNYGQHSPPLEPLRGLISTDFVSCGLRLDGTPACWGALETVAAPPAVAMLSLDLGPQHGCAVLPDAGLLCWGDLAGGRTAPPEGRQWRAVQVDSQSSCGLTLDGEALCWGDGALAQAAPPVGLFVELSAGEGFACARRADGEVVCWGRGDQGALQVPEEQRFVRIKAATDGACGVTVNGEVRCWGRNLLGEGIPTGGFVDLAPAQWQDARDPLAPRWLSHHCALDAGGEMVCFVGTGIYGDDVAIPGRFRELTAGAIHTCAARASDGIVQCTQHPLADMPR